MNSESIMVSPFNNLNGGFNQRGGSVMDALIIIMILTVAFACAVMSLMNEWKASTLPALMIALTLFGCSMAAAMVKYG